MLELLQFTVYYLAYNGSTSIVTSVCNQGSNLKNNGVGNTDPKNLVSLVPTVLIYSIFFYVH